MNVRAKQQVALPVSNQHATNKSMDAGAKQLRCHRIAYIPLFVRCRFRARATIIVMDEIPLDFSHFYFKTSSICS
jgi:hypothetical protein